MPFLEKQRFPNRRSWQNVCHPNSATLTTLQFWHTYCQHRDAIKSNKETFQEIMPKEICYAGLTDEGVARRGKDPTTFSEIILCQGCFPGNSFLCHSPRHLKLSWSRHSQNLLGGPVCLIEKIFNRLDFQHLLLYIFDNE